VEILLVEDNPADAELTLRVLQKQRIVNRILWLKDGAEALEFLFSTDSAGQDQCRNKPRMILLDLKLPKVDGLEVLRKIKDHEEMRTTPVVVMTSSQEERDLVESYRLGVNSYVVKPVDFAQFADAVRQLGLYWLLINKTPVA
jgi:two-component system response regulator